MHLVTAHRGALLAALYSRLGYGHDHVEDLLQETLAKAWQGFSTLSHESKFGGWLYTIASRVAIDWTRKKRPDDSLDRLGQEGFDPPAPPPPVAPDGQAEAHLLRALAQLPEIYRETLHLMYFQRHSYEEMARLLGISKAAVNARLTKGRKRLRTLLRERGEESTS